VSLLRCTNQPVIGPEYLFAIVGVSGADRQSMPIRVFGSGMREIRCLKAPKLECDEAPQPDLREIREETRIRLSRIG
jgi:hypothetical protein